PLARVLTRVGEDEAEAAMHGVAGGAAEEREEQERLSPNVSSQTHLSQGDVARGFAAAEVTAEGTFQTAWVHQGYIEPQTCVAAPDGLGGVVAYASTQGIFRTRTVVAQTLGLPQHQVRIVPMAVGGYEAMTNRLGPAAYRAPGNPQASFAVESVLDDLAERLGLDPLALRLRNAAVEGDPRPDGKPWPRIGLVECLERLRDHPL